MRRLADELPDPFAQRQARHWTYYYDSGYDFRYFHHKCLGLRNKRSMSHIDAVQDRHQLTNGTGSVIAYQIENEITVLQPPASNICRICRTKHGPKGSRFRLLSTKSLLDPPCTLPARLCGHRQQEKRRLLLKLESFETFSSYHDDKFGKLVCKRLDVRETNPSGARCSARSWRIPNASASFPASSAHYWQSNFPELL
jgi:hypothetical protein